MFPNWEFYQRTRDSMRIIARNTLTQFWQSHPTSKESLEAWYKETEKADWKMPDDIKNDIHQPVFFRFVGTHAKYDIINAETV